MKKTLILTLLVISIVSLSACGKNKDDGAVIIQAQDTGRDTTTSELVTGDTAGKAEADMSINEKTRKEAEQNEVVSGWHAEVGREISILGEWECSDGSKWTLDNGYNLKYSKGSENYIGSYNFSYKAATLAFNFWNVEKIEMIVDKDESGQITGEHEFKTYKTKSVRYEILGYEHNEEYTTGTLKLKDSSGNELTATLKTPIAVDLSVKKASENKKEFDKKQKDAEDEEYAKRDGLTVEEYRERKETENEFVNQAEELGMTVEEYKESIGYEDEHAHNEHEHVEEAEDNEDTE